MRFVGVGGAWLRYVVPPLGGSFIVLGFRLKAVQHAGCVNKTDCNGRGTPVVGWVGDCYVVFNDVSVC
jgi:hypothetical protein